MKSVITNLIARLAAIAILIGCAAPGASAWPGMPVTQLHVDGKYLKDSNGKVINLHGFCQTFSPYFDTVFDNLQDKLDNKGHTWGWDKNVSNCLAWNQAHVTEMLDVAGWKMSFVRMHLDPYWSNTPGQSTTGENDISAFSMDLLDKYLDELFIPMAEFYINKGLYVVMRPPGVCPEKMSYNDAYHQYLVNVWTKIASKSKIKNNPGIMFELANEPVSVNDGNGNYTNWSDASGATLSRIMQDVINAIRGQGCNNVLWVPGMCWQQHYDFFAKHPVNDTSSGWGLGLAVHCYPGWFGSEGKNGDGGVGDGKSFRSNWDAQFAKLNMPIMVTEMDWVPASYGEKTGGGTLFSWGVGCTGVAGVNGFGANFKAIADDYGNVSWLLFTDPHYLARYRTERPASETFDFLYDDEACVKPVYQWFNEYASTGLPVTNNSVAASEFAGMRVGDMIEVDFTVASTADISSTGIDFGTAGNQALHSIRSIGFRSMPSGVVRIGITAEMLTQLQQSGLSVSPRNGTSINSIRYIPGSGASNNVIWFGSVDITTNNLRLSSLTFDALTDANVGDELVFTYTGTSTPWVGHDWWDKEIAMEHGNGVSTITLTKDIINGIKADNTEMRVRTNGTCTLTKIELKHYEFDPNFHIYLSLGQSNMEGNAKPEDVDYTNVPDNLLMMATSPYTSAANGKKDLYGWYSATPVLARDINPNDNGLGITDYFGRVMADNAPDGGRVGVIVVAIGGCGIDILSKNFDFSSIESEADWFKGYVNAYGGHPYNRMIECAKKAQKVGVIKGILLHQGCSNNGQDTWPGKVRTLYNNLISDLGLDADEVPLLVGETARQDQGGICWGHNTQVARVPNFVSNSYVISSEGLATRGDGFHFIARAYREFGIRYAERMLKIQGIANPKNKYKALTRPDVTAQTSTSGNFDEWFPLSSKTDQYSNGFDPKIWPAKEDLTAETPQYLGSYNSSTQVFTAGTYGQGGWEFNEAKDFTGYTKLVVELNSMPSGSARFFLFDENTIWNGAAEFDITDTTLEIDLSKTYAKSKNGNLDLSHIYKVTFWGNRNDISIKQVYLVGASATTEETDDSMFPLTASGFKPSVTATGTFDASTKTFTSGSYGQGGWRYTTPLDLSEYSKLVVELDEPIASGYHRALRIYDVNNPYNSEYAPINFDGTSTKYELDLATAEIWVEGENNKYESTGSRLNLNHIYYVTFFGNEMTAHIKRVYVVKEVAVAPVEVVLPFNAYDELFPLTADGFDATIWPQTAYDNNKLGTFDEATKTFTPGTYGQGGWHYNDGIDLSDYDKLVIDLQEAPASSIDFRIFSGNSIWSGEQKIVSLKGQTHVEIDLNDIGFDLSKLYYFTFWGNGSEAVKIKCVYVTKEMSVPSDGTDDWFPLTFGDFIPDIFEGDDQVNYPPSYDAMTSTFNPGHYGQGGWRYSQPMDFSQYDYLVVELYKPVTTDTHLNIYTTESIWGNAVHAEHPLNGDTKFMIFLKALRAEAPAQSAKRRAPSNEPIDLKNVRNVTFWSTGEEPLNIRQVYLTGDGTLTGIDDALCEDVAPEFTGYHVFNLQGIQVLHTMEYADVLRLPTGFYIVNGKKIVIR